MFNIVYSREPSTEFLSYVTSYLDQTFLGKINIMYYESINQRDQLVGLLSDLPAGDVIAFFGHGASNLIYGPLDKMSNKSIFINKNTFEIFNHKHLFCLSCRSAEFIKANFKKNSLLSAVGFGDIPTDWDDVLSAREQDSCAYNGCSEIIINTYREYINEIIKLTFDYFLNHGDSPYDLYNILLLFVNKQINNTYLNSADISNDEKNVLTSLLFSLKDEMLMLRRY